MLNQTTPEEFPGSRWWSFDFHTHSPASTDYQGNQSITPDEWLLGYMRAGIDCVAVTDHNSGAWVDRLKAALASDILRSHVDFRPLALFPGIELSVNGGVHLLVLFDPDCGCAEVDALRGAVGYRGTPGDSNGVTEDSLEICIYKARQHGALPIPAHVDGPKGLLRAVTDHNTLQAVLKSLTAVEVTDQSSQTFQDNAATLDGLSLVSASDSHKPSAIGKHCWVKMSGPDIQGLKLALLDGELAVLPQDPDGTNPNYTASQRITELRVGKLKLRRIGDLTVRLNPWFNAIIGGRGSGKSTLLECLRIGLNRGAELEDLPELQGQFERFQKVSKGRDSEGVFTDDSELEVEYLKDGEAHRMRWRASEDEPTLLERNGHEWQEVGQVTTSRFPVRIYSQKQVFEMAKNPHTLRRLMDEDPGLDKLGWQQKWDELQSRFLNLRSEFRRLGSELAERERIKGELRDLKRKIRVFEQGHHADVLKAYQQSQRQQALVNAYLEDLGARLDEWQSEIGEPAETDFAFDSQDRFDDTNPDQGALLSVFKQLATDLSGKHQQMSSTLGAMQQRMQQARTAVEESAWQVAARAHSAAYESLKTELQAQGISDPSAYGQLVQQQQVHETRLRAFDEKQTQQNGLADKYRETYDKLKAWRLDLTQRRRDFLVRVLGDNQQVKVDLKPFGDRWRAEEDFRSLISKPRPTFADDILSEDGSKGLLWDLYVSEDGTDDPDGVADRIDTLKDELDSVGEELLLHTPVGKRFLNHLDGLRQQTPEVIDRLWCWFPEDEVKVGYRVPGSDGFRSVSQASAGQKTSAILSFLMAYGDEPLILDQPEDDLDNALIYELIVKQIRENKRRRQIIVVTHNPNIVVHGDAEWVYPLKFHKGSIQEDRPGGLQEIPVREAICEIMEGGVEAFEQRYRKIHDEVLGA